MKNTSTLDCGLFCGARGKSLAAFAVAAVLLCGLGAHSHAASIVWGAPTNISGDADVLTTGTLVGAFNLGGPSNVPSTTVNGVTFNPFNIPNGTATTTIGNFSFFVNNGVASNTLFGSSSPPFNALSASYQTLLESGERDFGGDPVLTISGLIIGQSYVFEWWANSSNSSTPSSFTTTATSGNAVTLITNTSGTDGGLGQYAIGSFVANSTSQVITFSGSDSFRLVNAFELRAVPEPSIWAMVAIGAGVLLALRRRSIRPS